jgi:hypothetical protein
MGDDDAISVAPMLFGLSPRNERGIKTSGRHSVDQGVSRRSDLLQERLHAIRRRLWILSATLECLPAKFELARRKSGVFAGGDGPDLLQDTHDEPGNERPTLKDQGALGGWLARWKLARLRSRAERADRRAAVALHNASASFSAALEAVLTAALASVKADEACLGPCSAPSPRRCDRPSPDAPGTMQWLAITSGPQRHQAR